MTQETAQGRYDTLTTKRSQFLNRAYEYAELTIPSLLPRNPGNNARLPEPYSSFVARLVTNLSSTLMMALLPPGQPFFRLTVPAEVLIKEGKMDVPPETQKGLSLAEQLCVSETERQGWRQPTGVSLLLLIVTGNACEQMLPDNTIRTFRLDQYAVVRDYAGNVVEGIIKETVSPLALPEEAQALMPERKGDTILNVDLYTWIKRTKDGYKVHQEIEGKMVPDSEGTYMVLPYNFLRWGIVPGEDYGRGKVEEHIGDIRSLEAMTRDLRDGSSMAARHVWMVRPNATGSNLKRRIAEASNGDVIIGNPEDVSMMQFQNFTGLQIAQAEVQRLQEVLAAAFLLRAGVVRDSERTTAAEVRMVAEELEGSLGGVYSLLSQEMQMARLNRLILQMQDQEKLPAWPSGLVQPQITTGLEALNREKDVMRVEAAANIARYLDPNMEYVKTGDLLKRAFIGLGLPADIRSEDEVAQQRQQRMMMEMAQRAAPQAVSAAVKEGQ